MEDGQIKEKRGRAKEVPGCLKANTVTKGSVELSCSKPGSAKDDNVVLYQVSMKKAVVIFLGKNAEGLFVMKRREGERRELV